MRIRMKRTGEVIDLPSGQARDLISRGSAVAVDEKPRAETTALDPANERAVTAAQNAPKRKPERTEGRFRRSA